MVNDRKSLIVKNISLQPICVNSRSYVERYKRLRNFFQFYSQLSFLGYNSLILKERENRSTSRTSRLRSAKNRFFKHDRDKLKENNNNESIRSWNMISWSLARKSQALRWRPIFYHALGLKPFD